MPAVKNKSDRQGNDQTGGSAGQAEPPDLDSFAEFDPDAGEKLHRSTVRKQNGAAVDLPSIMSDDDIEDAASQRRNDPHNPFVRKERPDPWPIIERQFPRIASTIRDQWGKRSLDDYFAQLVVDDRGSRQGFPPDVLVAILEVARLHGEQYRFAKPLHPWEADVSQSKWWDRGS